MKAWSHRPVDEVFAADLEAPVSTCCVEVIKSGCASRSAVQSPMGIGCYGDDISFGTFTSDAAVAAVWKHGSTGVSTGRGAVVLVSITAPGRHDNRGVISCWLSVLMLLVMLCRAASVSTHLC